MVLNATSNRGPRIDSIPVTSRSRSVFQEHLPLLYNRFSKGFVTHTINDKADAESGFGLPSLLQPLGSDQGFGVANLSSFKYVPQLIKGYLYQLDIFMLRSQAAAI